jgi:hypothetical protein
VLVFLGDHQPAPVVVGEGASKDVPITIVTRDRAVLDRVVSWGWQDGLKPAPNSPVWRMDAFRDRFLAAFGSQPGPAGSTPAPAGSTPAGLTSAPAGAALVPAGSTPARAGAAPAPGRPAAVPGR